MAIEYGFCLLSRSFYVLDNVTRLSLAAACQVFGDVDSPGTQTYVYDDTPATSLDGEAGGRGVVFLVGGPCDARMALAASRAALEAPPEPGRFWGLDGGDGPQDGVHGLLMRGYRLDRNRQVVSRL